MELFHDPRKEAAVVTEMRSEKDWRTFTLRTEVLASPKQIGGMKMEEKKKMTTKDIAYIPIFGALYAILVWVLQPISFLQFQFRVAESLKPSIAKKWTLCFGFALGNFLGNLISPFAGVHELVFMPLMNIVGGLIAWKLSFKNYFLAGIVYATIIALSVAWMLNSLFGIPLIILIPSLIVSEQVAMFLGSIVFQAIEKRWRWY